MFLDLISYVANALLGIMSTDLTFFETSVPVVVNLYAIFVAVGWGLLIGNCIFQCMKAMFSGLGFEGESPVILLCRTGIFGFLLIFSKQICEIGLGLGKSVIDLIGIPDKVTITLPDEGYFAGIGSSWVLVIIIGFILGFQLLKLFLEIGERYAVVAILTLLCPLGFAMGGSKNTKDICTGYIRTFASMVVMMVMNVLFLKLILSGLATMPTGILVLPWCVLLVGLVRVARKVDNIISKIGLSPAITGDPLGHGTGGMVAMMAARTIISSAARGGKGAKGGSNRVGGSRVNTGGAYSQNRNNVGGTKVGGASNSMGGVNAGGVNTGGVNADSYNPTNSGSTQNAQNTQSAQNSQQSRYGAQSTSANTQSAQASRFGNASYGGAQNSGGQNSSSNVQFAAGSTSVNTNRFGANGARGGGNGTGPSVQGGVKPVMPVPQPGGKAPGKGGAQVGIPQKPGAKQTPQPFKGQGQGTGQQKGRFAQQTKPGTAPAKAQPGIKQNTNPFGKPAAAQPGGMKTTPKTAPAAPKPAPPKGFHSTPAEPKADNPQTEATEAPEIIPPPQDGDANG